MEPGAEERDAVAVRRDYRLHRLAAYLGCEDGCAGGQTNFQEGLRMVSDGEFDFGERAAIGGDEGGGVGAIGDGGSDGAAGEPLPFEVHGGGFTGLAVIAERR